MKLINYLTFSTISYQRLGQEFVIVTFKNQESQRRQLLIELYNKANHTIRAQSWHFENVNEINKNLTGQLKRKKLNINHQ